MDIEFNAGDDSVSYILQVHLVGGGCLQFVLPVEAIDQIMIHYKEWRKTGDEETDFAVIYKTLETSSGPKSGCCGVIDFNDVSGMCLGTPWPTAPKLLCREERDYYKMAVLYMKVKMDSVMEGEEWRQGLLDEEEDSEDEDDMEMYMEIDTEDEDEDEEEDD